MGYWFQVTGTCEVPVTLAQIFIEEQLYSTKAASLQRFCRRPGKDQTRQASAQRPALYRRALSYKAQQLKLPPDSEKPPQRLVFSR